MNKDTIELINDLKYKLKFRDENDRIAQDLNNALDNIINIYVLDQDSHAFATVPEALPNKIGSFPKHMRDIKEWVNLIYQWVPDEPISIPKFIARCIHNSTGKVDITHSVRAAILSLKEDGRINIDNNNLITKIN